MISSHSRDNGKLLRLSYTMPKIGCLMMNTLINSCTAPCSLCMAGDLVLFVKDLPIDFKRDSYER